MIYGIKDCANLTLFKKSDGLPFLFTDYANVSTNEWTAERTYANAKGTRSIAWDSDKQSTLVVEMEVFDLKWLALTAGSEVKKGEAQISKREVLKVAGGKVTLEGSPIKGSVAVVPVGVDEVEHIGEPLVEVESAPTAGQYSVSGNDISFEASTADGTAFAVYYVVNQTDVRSITISSDKFPEAFRVVGDVLIRERESGTDEFVQIDFENARPQSNFTVTMSASEPTNLQITFDLFPNKDKEIATYKVIG